VSGEVHRQGSTLHCAAPGMNSWVACAAWCQCTMAVRTVTVAKESDRCRNNQSDLNSQVAKARGRKQTRATTRNGRSESALNPPTPHDSGIRKKGNRAMTCLTASQVDQHPIAATSRRPHGVSWMQGKMKLIHRPARHAICARLALA